jgi:hypothetical protein
MSNATVLDKKQFVERVLATPAHEPKYGGSIQDNTLADCTNPNCNVSLPKKHINEHIASWAAKRDPPLCHCTHCCAQNFKNTNSLNIHMKLHETVPDDVRNFVEALDVDSEGGDENGEKVIKFLSPMIQSDQEESYHGRPPSPSKPLYISPLGVILKALKDYIDIVG